MSVGLDIGSRTIKVVDLNREGKGYALKSAGAVAYSGVVNVEQMKTEKEMAGLAEAIKKLLKDAKVSGKSVSFSLPETQAYTRVMKFPLLNDQEIASAVKWEAEEYIPIPIKEAVIEHQILERREAGNPPQVLVLIVAVQKEIVEKYIKIIDMAGYSVVGVETELMSLVRSVSVPNATSMIVDFGAKSTDIAIAKDEQLFFSRSVSTAGEAFTRAVGQALGVSFEQAEQYKKAYGLTQEQLEGKVGKALIPIFQVVVEEIKKSIHYYQLELKGDIPTQIVLVGGSAGLPGASSYLTKATGLEVVIGNPFSKISLDEQSAKNLANYAPLYAISCGLAMRGE